MAVWTKYICRQLLKAEECFNIYQFVYYTFQYICYLQSGILSCVFYHIHKKFCLFVCLYVCMSVSHHKWKWKKLGIFIENWKNWKSFQEILSLCLFVCLYVCLSSQMKKTGNLFRNWKKWKIFKENYYKLKKEEKNWKSFRKWKKLEIFVEW